MGHTNGYPDIRSQDFVSSDDNCRVKRNTTTCHFINARDREIGEIRDAFMGKLECA